MSDKVDLGFAEVSTLQQGRIISVKFKNDPTIDLEAAKKMESLIVEKSQSKPIVVFVDMRNVIGEFESPAKKNMKI